MDDIPQQILSSTAKKLGISAAPGAGKTSGIIMPKLSSLLNNPSIDPATVLLLTFSRLSAADLKTKVQLMDKVPRVNTVHGYALSLLLSENNHSIRKRVENFVFPFEKDALLADLKLVFPKRHKNDLAKQLVLFSAAWAQAQQDDVFEEDDIRRSFKYGVMNWLTEYEAVLLDEIMYHAVAFGRSNRDAKLICAPKYIIVDEYQDLNKLEQEFVDLLAADSELLLIAGDPDQSIYSFKYAHPEGIEEFNNRSDVKSFNWSLCKRCPKKVVALANELLRQAAPNRSVFLKPLDSAIDGEIRCIESKFQDEEFKDVVKNISTRLAEGTKPSDILVLVPRRKLGFAFTEAANACRTEYGINRDVSFGFASPPALTPLQQERILLFALVANPDSVLHLRSYLGLPDLKKSAQVVADMIKHYGNLREAYAKACAEDHIRSRPLLKKLCDRIVKLREFITRADKQSLDELIDELFPEDIEELATIRQTILKLKEPTDSVEDLCNKLTDDLRSIPTDPSMIRVMTIMGSKGLDANHVYILGCNSSAIPGDKQGDHLSDLQHQSEQLRLLFVGVTRAKKSLQLSWSRFITYQQALQHKTPSFRTHRQNGQAFGQLQLSHFLSNVRSLVWERPST